MGEFPCDFKSMWTSFPASNFHAVRTVSCDLEYSEKVIPDLKEYFKKKTPQFISLLDNIHYKMTANRFLYEAPLRGDFTPEIKKSRLAQSRRTLARYPLQNDYQTLPKENLYREVKKRQLSKKTNRTNKWDLENTTPHKMFWLQELSPWMASNWHLVIWRKKHESNTVLKKKWTFAIN